MTRKKRYPETTLGAHYWLKYSVLRYLENSMRQDKGGHRRPPDIYRMLSLCEAQSIIERILVEMERDWDS